MSDFLIASLSFYDIIRYAILEFFPKSFIGIRILSKRLFLERMWRIYTQKVSYEAGSL
jgi:hypothetical protein